jgi:hypothetical protein
MNVIGSVPKEQLVARLLVAIQRNEPHLLASQTQETFRSEAQILREQQDREYLESLEADRRKVVFVILDRACLFYRIQQKLDKKKPRGYVSIMCDIMRRRMFEMRMRYG